MELGWSGLSSGAPESLRRQGRPAVSDREKGRFHDPHGQFAAFRPSIRSLQRVRHVDIDAAQDLPDIDDLGNCLLPPINIKPTEEYLLCELAELLRKLHSHLVQGAAQTAMMGTVFPPSKLYLRSRSEHLPAAVG